MSLTEPTSTRPLSSSRVCRSARSGEEALSIAARAHPDLILLDIMMPPGIDGYEVCRRLKADPETEPIPVIFLSALDDTDDPLDF